MPFLKFANSDLLEARVAHKGDRLLKSAHQAVFDYTPREGYLYVRSRAISSRTNDNFDSWPPEELRQAWGTFIGKPVFVNHHNDDIRRKRGVIIDAVLHEDTSPDGTLDVWIEVLMEIDAIRFPRLAKAILKRDIERTSMGADVGESECSYCGNVATTPSTYCAHIQYHKGHRLLRRNASTGATEEVLVHEICIAQGEMVSTLRGLVPIESVVVGDMALTRAGWRVVTDARQTGVRPTVKVTLSDGTTLRCTEDHLIATAAGWTPAMSLLVGDVHAETAVSVGSLAGVHVGVRYGELVPSLAVGLERVPVVEPVCGRGNQSKVIGVDAVASSTDVIDFDSIKIVPEKVHHSSVNQSFVVRVAADAPVSIGRSGALPDQALILGNGPGEQSFQFVQAVCVNHDATVPVYDLTVEGEHEFVVNGIVVHNCRKISFFENSVLVEPPADPTAFFLGVDDSGVRSLGMTAKTASKIGFIESTGSFKPPRSATDIATESARLATERIEGDGHELNQWKLAYKDNPKEYSSTCIRCGKRYQIAAFDPKYTYQIPFKLNDHYRLDVGNGLEQDAFLSHEPCNSEATARTLYRGIQITDPEMMKQIALALDNGRTSDLGKKIVDHAMQWGGGLGKSWSRDEKIARGYSKGRVMSLDMADPTTYDFDAARDNHLSVPVFFKAKMKREDQRANYRPSDMMSRGPLPEYAHEAETYLGKNEVVSVDVEVWDGSKWVQVGSGIRATATQSGPFKVCRGFQVQITDRQIAERIVAGKATSQDIMSMVSPSGVGIFWGPLDNDSSKPSWEQWDVSNSQEYAHTDMNPWNDYYTDFDAGEFGEIGVVLVGESPIAPDDFRQSIPAGTKVTLNEIYYGAGPDHWHKVPVTMTVTASAPSEEETTEMATKKKGAWRKTAGTQAESDELLARTPAEIRDRVAKIIPSTVYGPGYNRNATENVYQAVRFAQAGNFEHAEIFLRKAESQVYFAETGVWIDPHSNQTQMFGSIKTAWGETKAPPKVNTLGLTECPVCGSTNQFDSTGRCTTCGHLPAPEPFRVPDLEVAQKVDMRDDWVNPELLGAPAFVPPDGVNGDAEETPDRTDPVRSATSAAQEVEGPQGEAMRPSSQLTARLAAENAALRAQAGLPPRRADIENPAQPVPEPGAGAPSQSTEETRSADTTTDVTTPGAAMTDVSADTTTDVTTPGAAATDVAADSTTEVTTPVAGAGEQRPYNETVTLITPDASGASNGSDKTNAFAEDNSWVQAVRQQTRERVFSSLHLARLRVQAGIQNGDDLSIAQKIEASAATMPELRSEINALTAVVRVNASLTPQRRQATAARSVPSLAPTSGPSLGVAIASAPSADEINW